MCVAALAVVGWIAADALAGGSPGLLSGLALVPLSVLLLAEVARPLRGHPVWPFVLGLAAAACVVVPFAALASALFVRAQDLPEAEQGRLPALPELASSDFKGPQELATLLAHADDSALKPIVYAAALGFTPVVRRLLDAGVYVNARYGNDLTLLMWAAGYADGAGVLDAVAVVNLVLDRGAAIDARDNRGRTALMIAAERGHAAIAALLIARGAAAELRDKGGKTARDLAANDEVRSKLP